MYYYQLNHYSEFERTATLNICNFSLLKSLRSAFSNQISLNQEIKPTQISNKENEINYQ